MAPFLLMALVVGSPSASARAALNRVKLVRLGGLLLEARGNRGVTGELLPVAGALQQRHDGLGRLGTTESQCCARSESILMMEGSFLGWY